MSRVLTIDGSYGEGGGQILRTSMSLAAILGQAIRIKNIRAGRSKPGLQPQHLTAVRAVSRICDGRLGGDSVGSTRLEFHPGSVKSGDYKFDVSEIKASAGAVNLILQTVLLPLAFARKESRVTLRGGTHVPWSPIANYIDDVYLPVLSRMGLLASYRMNLAGYYPIGGGEIVVDIRPSARLNAITLTERTPGQVTCYSAVSNLPESIAERQMSSCTERLRQVGVRPVEVIDEYPSKGKGTVLFVLYNGGDLKAGFSSLGKLGKPAEKVGAEAAEEFLKWHESGAVLDKHLADQLIVPMSLAHGDSAFTTEGITLHLTTNVWTVGRFLPVKVDVDEDSGAVRVTGAGFE